MRLARAISAWVSVSRLIAAGAGSAAGLGPGSGAGVEVGAGLGTGSAHATSTNNSATINTTNEHIGRNRLVALLISMEPRTRRLIKWAAPGSAAPGARFLNMP